MHEQGQSLPPAAVAQWYELAIAVVKGVEDPQEREEWMSWAVERELLRTMDRAAGKGFCITAGARRMGDYDGAERPSRNKSYKTRET